MDPDKAGAEHVLPLADAGPVAILPAVAREDPDLGVAGLGALAVGWLWSLIGFMEMGNAIIECAPDVDLYIIWGAVPSALLPAAYGTVVYIISLIIRVVRKPKM